MTHSRFAGFPRKSVLITGASGFIGSHLCAFLSTAGHRVFKLVRRIPQRGDERRWDPAVGALSPEVFEGIDVVIHLAGSNIADKRWTTEVKQEIEQSRVRSTALLAQTISALPKPPELFITASGIGFYGDTGSAEVDESAAPGRGFLADVCKRWEEATNPLESTKVRVVKLRLGTVLNARGGALRKMLPAFSFGVGGTLGSGKQYMSWISIEDLLGIFEYTMYTEGISGPVNAVSPNPCTNKEFTRAMGKALGRPTILPVPERVLRLCFGEMAQDALLASTRAVPKVLLNNGYSFVFPEVGPALAFACGK
jgi:uncharacterized protein (TIGR01777 family)